VKLHHAGVVAGSVISGPVSAAAFPQRRIAFVILRGIGVTQFVEKSSS
jgi:hypothetical protein